MDDIVLVNSALSGNYKARETLLQNYYDEIYTYIYKSIANQEVAYELTHNVLMQLSANLKKYRTASNKFSVWLYKLTTQCILDHYSSEEHKIKIDNYKKELSSEADDELLEDAMLRSEQETKILEVLLDFESLNERQKAIIILNYYTELDNLSIATILKSNRRKVNKIKNETISILQSMSNNENKINMKEITI